MQTSILINGKPPNLFRQLLSYRPRATNDSRENFLTESFAYVLAMDPTFARHIMQAFLGERFAVKSVLSLRTQISLADEDGRGLPDLMALVELRDGGRAQVWVENKWGSAADADQLLRYLKKLDRHERDVPKHLVLLTPRHTDAVVCPTGRFSATISHLSWSKIHEVVRTYRAHAMTHDFETFLNEAQRLVVQPITLANAREYRERLFVLCERVCDALPESVLTADKQVVLNYGRAGISFYDLRITLGVLHDPADHATAFLNPEKPLDLILRIEGRYKGRKKECLAMRTQLGPIVKALETAGFACDQGQWRSNGNSLLLAHDRSGFPFDLSADDQVQRVLDSFTLVLAVLNRPRHVKLLSQVDAY
jgi:hypothetical protein